MKDIIQVQIPKESAKYVLDILQDHQSGYSVDFASERIVKIRQVIDILRNKLYK